MGRGDNRRTLKHRRRKAQKKLKARILKRKSGAGRTVSSPAAKVAKVVKKPAPAKTATKKATTEA